MRIDAPRSIARRLCAGSEMHRQNAYPRVFIRPRPLDRSGNIDRVDRIEQFVENDTQFEASEARTEAVVHAATEAEMRVRVTSNVELERFVEHVFVAVRGCFPEHDLVARAHPLPAQFDVARRGATVVRRG